MTAMMSYEMIHQIEHALGALLNLLLPLQNGEYAALEYGEEGIHFGVQSAFYIRWINTAGGMQFGLHHINRPFGLGSGFYTPDGAELISHARSRLMYYHRPQPNIERLRAILAQRRAERGESPLPAHGPLTFFGVQTDTPTMYEFAPNDLSEFIKRIGPVETITLPG
jgi:hypothetical protein